MLDAISNSIRPYNEIIGVAGILIGAIFASFFYHRAKVEKRPRFGIFSQTILAGATTALQGLQVSFGGKAQDRVTVSRIFFWNDGRAAIRSVDNAQTDPIRINVLPGADVLSAKLLASTSDACGAYIAPNLPRADPIIGSMIYLNFEFLNYRDGFVIDIVHNGPVDHQIKLAGTLIESKVPEHLLLNEVGYADKYNWAWESIWTTSALLGVVAFIGMITGNYWVLPIVALALLPTLDLVRKKAMPSVPENLRDKVTSGIRPL